ncbi:MAG: UvrD-helicase domain-containing protein [Desulfovibrio sp.]|jgi:uncharacterized protein (TIGR00375 family)|nr:UvrD-helicase domain-containing protein [Desulfovibrio sp.]
MREFLADLHIHSRFSRATSPRLSVPLLAAWAGLKGLDVLGSGDFTHPRWREELRQQVIYEEASGLYLLRDPQSAHAVLPELPVAAMRGKRAIPPPSNMETPSDGDAANVRFMLQGEISSIYKRGGKVRKVHNLVFMPNFEAAERFCLRLEQVGNLHSDGRPILGLDSRDLLELVLETHPSAFLVPAHIWTPWFSLFGSKSGFDRMEDCFGDLTGEIFALETGLSSDPAMNRLWSALDNCRLVSNSDAHSGENLGREANIFAGAVSYDGMLKALKYPRQTGDTAFLGTIEFFPEEGKYHMDGHRKCGIVLTPAQTRECGGVCPACGAPVTVGVLNRVMELADREEPLYGSEPEGGTGVARDGGFASLAPLSEILGEILGSGSKTRKVGDMYAKALERFGPELTILRRTPEDALARFFPPLGEAVARMRRGQVHLQGGYDGAYGVVRMFTDKERKELMRGAVPVPRKKNDGATVSLPLMAQSPPPTDDDNEEFLFSDQDVSQETPPEIPLPLPEQGKRLRVPGIVDGEVPLMPPYNGSAGIAALGGAPATLSADVPATHFPDSPSSHSVLAVPSPEGENPAPRQRIASLDLTLSPDEYPPLPKNDIPARFKTPAVSGVSASQVRDVPLPTAPLHATEALSPQKTDHSQERAVQAGPGPVLVLAGPGTGKTRTLIARMLSLLDKGISPRRILAVTFTRRAASEMDSRLSAALGTQVPLPRTDTLHALALEVWHKTNRDTPILLSEENARRVFAEANSEESAQLVREGWQIVNLSRERLEMPPPEFVEMGRRYMRAKTAWNLLDYTDLLEFWLERVMGNLFTRPWDHVLVDEVQDLSLLQLTLARSLLPASGEGFFAIGDPYQSIYSFRGAYGQCRQFLSAAWPDLEIIRLRHNYRSLSGIVEAARAVLGRQADGAPLLSVRGRQASIHLFEAPGADAEAAWIAGRISGLIGLGSHTLADAAKSGKKNLPAQCVRARETAAFTPPAERIARTSQEAVLPDDDARYSPGDFAILVRTHALGAPYRKALARAGVPVSDPAADAFWADERVALILHAAGRMLGIAVDTIGDATPAFPDKILAKGPLSVAAYMSSSPPFDALFWQSAAFRSLVKAYEANGGWAELISWISLQDELELVRGKAEKVQIVSLHAAKGLEFRVIFLPCLEDGLLPFAGYELLTGKLPEKSVRFDLEEEQRLFYVGITRAKDALYLSCAAKRLLYGRELRLKPSRFLACLPEELFSRSTLVARTRRKEHQLTLL